MFPDIFVFILAITAIVFGTWALVSITKMVVSYLEGRSSGPSLTANELASVIERAVEGAVRSLEEKIDRVEQRQRLLSEGRAQNPTGAGSEREEEVHGRHEETSH